MYLCISVCQTHVENIRQTVLRNVPLILCPIPRCQGGVANRRRPGWTTANHRKDLLKERDDAAMTANARRPRAPGSAHRAEAPPRWLACMELVEDVLCVVSLVYVGHQ